jgi:hypothetical protein
VCSSDLAEKRLSDVLDTKKIFEEKAFIPCLSA